MVTSKEIVAIQRVPGLQVTSSEFNNKITEEKELLSNENNSTEENITVCSKPFVKESRSHIGRVNENRKGAGRNMRSKMVPGEKETPDSHNTFTTIKHKYLSPQGMTDKIRSVGTWLDQLKRRSSSVV